jgi:putative transposase
MKKKEEQLSAEELKKKVLKQFMSGESLYGKNGAFAPMIKSFLESALEGELDAHLDDDERQSGNRRNGKTSKTIQSAEGPLQIETSRDRNSTFEPELIKKRETILADSLEKKIIGMYGLGMSFRDISGHLKEMYDADISHTTLSAVTDRIIPEIKEWQARQLESVYCIVWLDAMHYKVKDEGRIVARAVYHILGITPEGRKDLIGIYVSESEGAHFWLGILSDLRNRGVEDILIACIDNLKGFAEAIVSTFPKTEVQSCIVHQIRNSLKYVAKKDHKSFLVDLKEVYQATTKELAEQQLDALEQKWGKKYSIVLNSWRTNWHKLSTYFKYDPLIRKMIYTTNAIEGFHRQVRKVTKTKGSFPSDMALVKLIYLAYKNIRKKWTLPLSDWILTVSQLAIWFQGRLPLTL